MAQRSVLVLVLVALVALAQAQIVTNPVDVNRNGDTVPATPATPITQDTASFSVTVLPSPTAVPLTINNVRWSTSTDGGVTYVFLRDPTPGATFTFTGGNTYTLSFLGVPPSYDGVKVRATLRYSDNQVFSSLPATIYINKKPDILVQPVDQLILAGATATLSVVARAERDQTITYSWETNTDNLSGSWTTIAGAPNSPSFTTPPAAAAPASFIRYRVKVTANGLSNFSQSAVVRVAYISLGSSPSSQTVKEGSQGTFSVAFTSFPPAVVQWQVGGLDVAGGIAGQTNQYTTVPALLSMSGTSYTAVISNGVAKSVTSGAATLTVTPRLVISTQPVSRNVTASESTTFVVVASANTPITYRWQFSTNGGLTWVDSTEASANLATLALANIPATLDGVLYRVLVSTTDSTGTTTLTSAAARLGVFFLPIISVQPTRPFSIRTQDTVILSVTATGNPAPTYQWQSSLALTPFVWTNIPNNAQGPVYRVVGIPPLDSIFYRVIVSNTLGSTISSVVELRVNFP